MTKILLLFLSLCSFQVVSAKILFTQYELDNPQKFTTKYDSVFYRLEMPVAKYHYGSSAMILENSYASSEFINPESYSHGHIIDSLCIILSKYPIKESDWLTNYYTLLATRLKALYKLAPEVNDASLKHTLILQTACKNEQEAKDLFHGFIIYAHKTRAHLLKSAGKLGDAEYVPYSDSLVQLDSSYVPQANICFHHGITYALIEYKNEVWVAWENGLFVTSDTFQSFRLVDAGLNNDTLVSLAIFKGKLYGQGKSLKIWYWENEKWNEAFCPANLLQEPEGIFGTDSSLIVIYTMDDFYISRNGLNFQNRRYKVLEKGVAIAKNLSPGKITQSGDSLLFFSGNTMYLSTDYLLNIRPVFQFRSSEMQFAGSFIIDGKYWYLSGWYQDNQYNYHYKVMVSSDQWKHYTSLVLPERSYHGFQLFQTRPGTPLWLTGGYQEGFSGRRSYIRNADQWRRIDLPGAVRLYYAGLYIVPLTGGNLLLMDESILDDY